MVTRVLSMGRAAFERRMRDSCTITRPAAPVDDGRGGVTVEHGDVYEGRCYVRYPGLAQEATVDAAGAQVVVSRVVVRVPHGPVFRVGDVVEITASPDTPHLAGAVYRVASIDDQSQATAQRLLCEDLQAGVTL